MRRYSITYFIGQSIKGLWRNGVMSTASIMVLMSCLVVMGSFALLVLNINHNLGEVSALNEIVVYVDTSIKVQPESTETDENGQPLGTAAADTTAEPEKKPEDAYTISEPSMPQEMIPPFGSELDSDAATAMAQMEAWLYLLDNFMDLNAVQSDMRTVESSFAVLSERIQQTQDTNIRAEQQLQLEKFQAAFAGIQERISLIVSLKDRVALLENVGEIKFTSKAAGLEEYREKYAEYPNLFVALKKNPLPDKFTVMYLENSKVSTLQWQLEHLDPMLYRVICYTDYAQQVENIKQGIILIFSWFLVILFVVSLFVIINTVKLAVFARRHEISIMRYVGATNWFITLPFIFEGILIGLLASGIAYVIQYYMYLYIYDIVLSGFQLISIIPFADVSIKIALGFVALGVVTGIIGSVVSLRKYLKA